MTRMVNFSIKIIKELKKIDNTEIRVGINCGSVSIAYIGNFDFAPLKTAYGDDVNIAARMEQTSKKNLIHLSEKAAKLYAQENNLELDIIKKNITTYKNITNAATYFFDSEIEDFVLVSDNIIEKNVLSKINSNR